MSIDPCIPTCEKKGCLTQANAIGKAARKEAKAGGGTVVQYICTHCNKTSTSQLGKCPCKEASYCNVNCQKADWKKHKKECSARKKKPLSGGSTKE